MKLWKRLRYFWKRGEMDRDLEEEVRIHRQMAEEDAQRLGSATDEARHHSARAFGSTLLALEDSRSMWGFVWLDSVLQDVRYALRSMRKTPLFAATVIGIIGLALGLNTALFTAFNAYVLRPLAVQDPYSLYSFTWASKASPWHGFSWNDFQDFRAQNQAFSDSFVMRRISARYGNGLLLGELVSGDYFSMLGVGPALGRVLLPSDCDSPGREAIVVLSHSAWQSKFGGDPEIVGKQIVLRGHSYQVAGVSRAGFSGTANIPPDFWAPMTMYAQLVDSPDLFGPEHPAPLQLTGRLKPGITLEQARAALMIWATKISFEKPDAEAAIGVKLESAATFIPLVGETLAGFMPGFIAFGLVLLLACANVANMMLARALSRQREIGVRLALGAGRGRIIRQLLTESMLLGLAASLAGYGIGRGALRFGLWFFNSTISSELAPRVRFLPMELDARVFLFMLAASAAATLVFGLVPAWQVTRGDLIRATRGEFGNDTRPGRLRSSLVVSQVTVCLLLLICMGVLLRGGRKVTAQDVGLVTRGVLEFDRSPERGQRLADFLAADPSVELLAANWHTPLHGTLRTVPVGPAGGGSYSAAGYNFVSPEYFELFRLSLTRGRNFTAEEARAEAPVVIISEATAWRFWPGQDPLGKDLQIRSAPFTAYRDRVPQFASAKVIGVAPDVINGMLILGPDPSCLYFPTSTSSDKNHSLLARVRGNLEVARRSLETSLNAALPGEVTEIHRMDEVLDLQAYPFRLFSWISMMLGGLALVLTATGVYGVIAYIVSQRTKEIGIRMALGAEPAAVIRLVLAQSIKPALVGAILGTLLALVGAQLLASVILMNTFDVVAYGGGVALVLAATVVASIVPARRASRVDPITVLRYD